MSKGTSDRFTYPVSDDVFRVVYDSPAASPGAHRWVTPDADVRRMEELLGITAGSVGAPLWVSGDSRKCEGCGRQPSWLDIVASGLESRHGRGLIAQVILGDQKYVNTEAPAAIEDVRCFDCGAAIEDLRSFKCHNWAYAIGDLAALVEGITD